jgi:hypothetical protein
MPDAMSSGSEVPVMAAPSMVTMRPKTTNQVSRRGRRNAPVKKSRSRCSVIDATISNVAQW